MSKEFYRCKTCVTPNTRPRTIINDDGACSACLFKRKKKKINWNKRWKELKKVCDKFRSNDGSYDVLVPGGGGKDSSYVAWMLKNKLNMNPLTVCARPPMSTELGEKNLSNFSKSGFDVLELRPNIQIQKKINLNGLIKFGQPQIAWLTTILTVPISVAIKYNIKFMMYGEEAESEYGGLTSLEEKANFNLNHIKKAYLSNIKLNELIDVKKYKKNLDIYKLPPSSKYNKLFPCHWSYFEKWDEPKHLKIAEKFCGLTRSKKNTQSSYNNFSHLDQKMYLLHMYCAYLKFGFNRATTDSSIDVREGLMTRQKALNHIKKLDHLAPTKHYNDYAKYFGISKKKLLKYLEKIRNKKIFVKKNNKWKLDE
tara:strand:- start:1176 stop:2276 length:1101 start_codon:yes stop_codon:yes gene_type:complete